MEKPKFLYHGSPSGGISEFVPRQINFRDKAEGPLVFATSDKAFASMFMSPRKDDSWTRIGNFNGIYYIVISDEGRFRKGDIGGSLYVLPPDTFYQNPGLGMNTEWVSKEIVPVVQEISYDSTISAMVDHGVRVYFTSKEDFEIFINSTFDKMFEMMKGWNPLKK